MGNTTGWEIINSRPEESREAARQVIDGYGGPDEAGATMLVWYRAGPCKRRAASEDFQTHEFGVPLTDWVQSFADDRVPPAKVTPLAMFDGSAAVLRATGVASAGCLDEQANFLALGLMHDIVTGKSSADGARVHYGEEFADHRRGKAAPPMDKLRFRPGRDAAVLGTPIPSDDEPERSAREVDRKDR